MEKFPAKTRRNARAQQLKESFAHSPEKAKNRVWLAGRIVGILDDGFVLQDETDRIDLQHDQKVRVGDIVEVAVEGSYEVLDDGTGEHAVFRVWEFAVLAPCQDDFFIQPSDPRYRRSVVDRSLSEKLKQRAAILDGIREFFGREGFLEVETPSMVSLPGMEPYLDVFKTEFVGQNGKKEDRYLVTSPEYALKKLLVAGHEKIFQICKSFRNKETDSQLHNPEFTLLEWYRAYASYEEIMEDTQRLVSSLAEKISYNGHEVDLSAPWPRVKVVDLFGEYAGISAEIFEDEERFFEAARAKGYSGERYDDLFFSVFMNEIEPKLGFDTPVIVYEYPASMAALAKKCHHDPRYSERFEVYVAGMELCNAFTELNDPVEQRERLEAEREERLEMGKEDYPVDQSFVRALEFGMPPSGGNALGVDRLVMLLTDTLDIRDIISFPHQDL